MSNKNFKYYGNKAEKKTALNNNIGQSNPTDNIPQNSKEVNTFDEKLQTKIIGEIMDTYFEPKEALIDGILYSGVYILAGAPKLGKSFLAQQVAYHIATGTPIFDLKTSKGTVLYLALEDTYERISKRNSIMFGQQVETNLFYAIEAKGLGKGLEEQLQGFIDEHKDTNLIIIDTLQKILFDNDDYSYAKDYHNIAALKKFANDNKICLLVVHHTRKQKADDRFDMISGTNGLMGASDGALILSKADRMSSNAVLDISGRDQQDTQITLSRNPKNLQ